MIQVITVNVVVFRNWQFESSQKTFVTKSWLVWIVSGCIRYYQAWERHKLMTWRHLTPGHSGNNEAVECEPHHGQPGIQRPPSWPWSIWSRTSSSWQRRTSDTAPPCSDTSSRCHREQHHWATSGAETQREPGENWSHRRQAETT